jgi:hypothetical protein
MTQLRVSLCLLLTLAALVAGIPIGASHGGHTPSVLADEGKDESGNDDEDKNEEEGKDDGKDDDKDDKKGRVKSAAPYKVEVDCAYDEDANATTCTFTGVAPPDAKDVSHVDLPASEVCTDVLGGEHEFVDPDPNTRVVGYKSRGSEGTFTLVLDGQAAPAGTATYWFKTGDGVFPATGPGLRCGEAATQQQVTATAEATQQSVDVTAEATQQPVNVTAEDTDEDTTGAVLVWTFGCTVASPPAEYDWYGACEPGPTPIRFSLTVLEGDQLVAVDERATDADGQVRFEALTPGTYHLEAIDASWCHAESDNVNEEGDLVVTGGAAVNVWTFFCGETLK